MIKSRHQIQNTLEDVDHLVTSLEAVVCLALGPEATSRFEICLSEALTNLVKHAKPKMGAAAIEITVTEQDQIIVVEILDPVGADPFDLRDHAVDLKTIDPLAEEGRGLGLIMQCADAVDYGPSGDHNRLALQFTKAAKPITAMQSGEQE